MNLLLLALYVPAVVYLWLFLVYCTDLLWRAQSLRLRRRIARETPRA